jgi:uncharacterized membrane protein
LNPAIGVFIVNTSSITMPFCQLAASIWDGTGAAHSRVPGRHSQTFADDGRFVSVMSPCGGDTTGGSCGGCGGFGFAQVLPLRPRTNCRSLISTTPSGWGELTSKDDA